MFGAGHSNGTEMSLTIQHRKEAVSRAHVRAVAARTGANISIPEHDYGTDVIFSEVTARADGERVRYVEHTFVAAQLKCSHDVDLQGGNVRYDLEAKTYNDLTMLTTMPRILILVHVPENEAEWVDFGDEAMVLKRSSYWFSLRGMTETTNSASVRISIPTAQRFVPAALQGMFDRIKAGGVP